MNSWATAASPCAGLGPISSRTDMVEPTIRRAPRHGATALAIGAGMSVALWYSTTAEGQRWIEQQLQPLGHAAILAYVLAVVMFFGSGFAVLALAISAAVRR